MKVRLFDAKCFHIEFMLTSPSHKHEEEEELFEYDKTQKLH